MESRFKIPFDLPSEHIRSKSEYIYQGKFTELRKIKEEDEWSSIASKSIASKILAKKPFMRRHCIVYNIPPSLSSNPTIARYQTFLNKLLKHPKIYENFIKQSISSSILKPSLCRPNVYYYKHIHYSNNDKFRSLSKSVISKNNSSSLNDSEIYDYSSTSEDISEEYNIYNNQVPRINEFIKSLKILQAKKEKSPVISSRAIKKKHIVQRRMILDKGKDKLVRIFQDMCRAPNSLLKSCRLTNYLFKNYLVRKFPYEMTEAISKHFDFKSANYEDFCIEVDRVLASPDEKILGLCFDAFDFNRDRYICYQDTYAAIKHRKDNLYDQDMIKLDFMLECKKTGTIPVKSILQKKNRRPSVFSITSDMSFFDEHKKKCDIPPVHPDKPEAITFEDFCKIDFKGRPQLIYNLFVYICNYDINKCHEVVTPIVKSRRPSEEIVIELSQTITLPEEYKNDPKLEYYRDLEEAMELFGYTQAKDLLDKFEVLRDKTETGKKVINKNSMVENWGKLFGIKSEYISERYFYYMTHNKNAEITKPEFLRRVYYVVNDEMEGKILSFEIYDARGDGKITSDEVCRLEKALPEGTRVYEECTL